MTRPLFASILFLGLCGCDGRQLPPDRPAVDAAFTAPADPISTVSRRVWSGPDADYMVGITPDGRRAAYTDWDTGDLMLRHLVTGEVENLTRNPQPYQPGYGMTPRISRDGKRAVFTWWQSEESVVQLRAADLDGSGARVIYEARTPTYIQAEDWSPDGQTILAFRTQEDGTTQIVLVPSDSGLVRVLKTLDWRQPMRMNFSPDGRFVVYDFPVRENSNSDRDLFVLDLETGRESRLVEHAANDYLLGWAPEGGHVLFASDRTGTPGAWLLPVEEGRAVSDAMLVKPDLWGIAAVSFATDGSYFFGVRTGNRSVYLSEFDPGAGRVVGSHRSFGPTLTGGALDPQWSPDGRSLSYLVRSDRDDHFTLVVRSLETGEAREILVPPSLDYPLHQWSPDGNAIVLSANERGRPGIFQMDLQTGRTETVFKLGLQEFVGGHALTPDGQRLFYIHSEKVGSRQRSLVARDLEDGAERVLYGGATPTFIRSLALSPDGGTVAFLEPSTAAGRNWEITLVALPGGGARTVGSDFRPTPVGQGGLTWSADGRSLLAVGEPAATATGHDGRTSDAVLQLWRVPLDGGAAEATGLAMERLGDPRMDPQGRRIAFAAGHPAAELWVLDGFLPRSIAARTE